MFARIAGVKVESSWTHARRGIVRCTVRLTRALTEREKSRLVRLIEIDSDGDRLFYVCRPEEVEEREERVDAALSAISGEKKRRSTRRKSRSLSPSTPVAG